MDLESIRQYAYRAFEWLYSEPYRLAAEWRENANRRSIAIIVAGGTAALLAYTLAIAPPEEFPVGVLVPVPEGTSAAEVGQMLQEQGVVRQGLVFRVAVQILGRDRGVRAGDYLFKEPRDVFSVARAITTGSFGLEPIVIRIPEGATTHDMAKVYASQLQRFNAEKFLEKAKPHEGYLFPDTYYFMPNASEETVFETMRQNFDAKVQTLSEDVAKSGKPLGEIVIMASILEKEAHNYKDRQMIAGVLWRRIKINMPLQVDAAFLYSLGRTTYDLTTDDLQNKDDPYNTYVHKGLPPGAIGSPSISSLRAAANAIDGGYLFYLADRNHVTYYSKTYEEHLEKKALYIGS
jgi:UPF0755 protein